MIDRRELLLLAGGSILSAPLPARAQQASQRFPRVGYLFSFTRAEGAHLWEACRQGLRELGWIEGQNITLEPRWADGQHARLPELVSGLVKLEADVIVTAATPATRAAKAATSTIPIVFVGVGGDPVKTGLIASLGRPGGNLTGLSLLTSELSGKRLQLLMECLRKTEASSARVAVLLNPENPTSAIFLEETEAAARNLQVRLLPLDARNQQEIERAFEAAAKAGAGSLIVFDDPVIWSHRGQIVLLAARGQIPAMYGYRDFVDEGGLVSYGPDRIDQYRRTAGFVHKILKGAKPSELPVEQPTRFELVLNMKTAKALGLAPSPAILFQTTEVIE